MYDICSGLGLGFYIFRGVEHEMAYSKRSEIKIWTFMIKFFISLENARTSIQNKYSLEADGLEIFEIEADTRKHDAQEVMNVMIN